jgi:hypothetical protein
VISPSPKLSCTRLHLNRRRPARLRCGSGRSSLAIELADGLDRLLELLIVVEPAANFGDPFSTNAELLNAPPAIAHGQDEHPVAFAARAFRAVFGVTDRALQQRAAQHLPGDRQFADKLVARSNGSVANHSLE